MNRCPRGAECNFLHVFRNPGGAFSKADRDCEDLGNSQRTTWSYRGKNEENSRHDGTTRCRDWKWDEDDVTCGSVRVERNEEGRRDGTERDRERREKRERRERRRMRERENDEESHRRLHRTSRHDRDRSRDRSRRKRERSTSRSSARRERREKHRKNSK